MDKGGVHGLAVGVERLLQSAPVGGGLGQAKATLAPQDAGQFFDVAIPGAA